MRALFLVNPNAHKVRKRGSALLALADRTGTLTHLLDAHFSPTESADRVYIEGGDGTVRWVVSAYLKAGIRLPQFAIVKGGTTDQVAGVVGLHRATAKQLEETLDQPLEAWEFPLMEVETETDTHHGFVFSTGAIPRVTAAVERYRGPAGISGAALVGRAIIDATKPGSPFLESSPATVSADQGKEVVVIDGDHLGTIATTLPTLYLGLDPFWGTGEGRMRVTYARGDAKGLVPTIVGQWAGLKNTDKLERRGYQSFNTDHFRIETDAPVVLDGDALEGRVFTLKPTQPVTFVR